MEVKHQREDRLAGHVVKLDLAPAQVLSGGERIDLSGFGGSLSDGRVIIRVLDVNFPSWFAGEDVRLAAAEPNVPSGSRRFRRNFVVLKTKWVQPLEALNFLTLNEETDLFLLHILHQIYIEL